MLYLLLPLTAAMAYPMVGDKSACTKAIKYKERKDRIYFLGDEIFRMMN